MRALLLALVAVVVLLACLGCAQQVAPSDPMPDALGVVETPLASGSLVGAQILGLDAQNQPRMSVVIPSFTSTAFCLELRTTHYYAVAWPDGAIGLSQNALVQYTTHVDVNGMPVWEPFLGLGRPREKGAGSEVAWRKPWPAAVGWRVVAWGSDGYGVGLNGDRIDVYLYERTQAEQPTCPE